MLANLVVYLTFTEIIVLYNQVNVSFTHNLQNSQLRIPIEIQSKDLEVYFNVVFLIQMKNRFMEFSARMLIPTVLLYTKTECQMPSGHDGRIQIFK